MTSTPPPAFWYWESFYSLTKKCPWLWWSILRYTNVTFETWPCDLCVNIYIYIYVYIYIYKCMYVCMYVYTCKRMSSIYSMSCIYLYGAQRLRSGSKAGSGCKTALAAAGPPISAWSTPWNSITSRARMFASRTSLPASSDMIPRSQWRPKGPWEKNIFLAGKKS